MISAVIRSRNSKIRPFIGQLGRHGRALVARYKTTRNGLLGEAYSSKLSPWLANGALSPRRATRSSSARSMVYCTASGSSCDPRVWRDQSPHTRCYDNCLSWFELGHALVSG